LKEKAIVKPRSMLDMLSTAENTKQKIMSRPEAREAFQELLDEHLPPEKLVRCTVEGLDATQVKLFSREDYVIETVVLPDHRSHASTEEEETTPPANL
jgi:hypothetical protein